MNEPQQNPHPHLAAYDRFAAANHVYQLAEEYLTSGELAAYVVVTFPNDPASARSWVVQYMAQLQDKLEQRNVALREASDALRQKVQLEPTKWRGPEGKPTTLTVGQLTATSVTGRSFDQKTLFDRLQKLGLLERLLAVTTTDKDGTAKPIIQQSWEISFPDVLQWLKGNKLDEVLTAAYDEKEKTPQVKGAKPLAFLGEPK